MKSISLPSRRIKALREARELSQTELSHLSKISGSALSRIEKGKNSPQWKTLVSIAKSLKIPVIYLIKEADDIMTDLGLKDRIFIFHNESIKEIRETTNGSYLTTDGESIPEEEAQKLSSDQKLLYVNPKSMTIEEIEEALTVANKTRIEVSEHVKSKTPKKSSSKTQEFNFAPITEKLSDEEAAEINDAF